MWYLFLKTTKLLRATLQFTAHKFDNKIWLHKNNTDHKFSELKFKKLIGDKSTRVNVSLKLKIIARR